MGQRYPGAAHGLSGAAHVPGAEQPGDKQARPTTFSLTVHQVGYLQGKTQCLNGETVTGGGFHLSPGSGLDIIGSSPLFGGPKPGWDVAFENRSSTATPEATLTIYANCTKGTTSTK